MADIERSENITDVQVLQKRLLAYQRAFNRVDDIMEYSTLDQRTFVAIAEDLNTDLINASK